MTEGKTIAVSFKTDFESYEPNRMYPPEYRKEAAMKKLNLKHVSAISHAEMFIHPAIRQSMTPRQREEIEKDLVRLAEVKRFILKAMYEPGLPLTIEVPEEN